MENDVTSESTTSKTKIKELNKQLDNQSSAQNILPPSFTKQNPESYEKKNNSKFSKALKLFVTNHFSNTWIQRSGQFT